MSRQEADNLNKVEIWWLKKYGYIQGWKSGGIKWKNSWSGNESSIGIEGNTLGDEKYIRFFYTITRQNGEKKQIDYKISLTTTPCNYGGQRYWFICSLSVNGRYCGRRVGTLYYGGDYYGCRHCYDLTYNSRNLSGASKVAGQVISMPELDKLKSEVKRKYYAGKITRRHKRYLKKEEKSLYQLQVMVGAFSRNKQ